MILAFVSCLPPVARIKRANMSSLPCEEETWQEQTDPGRVYSYNPIHVVG